MKVSSTTGSTFYPCTEDDIKALTISDFTRFTDPIFGKPMSREEATVELERLLLPETPIPKSASNALQRLRNMLTWEKHDWGPDLVVKSCYDWDKVFFNRRLKGHVTINWSTHETLQSANSAYSVQGRSIADDVSWRWGHVRIELNADDLLLLPGAWSIQDDEAPVSQFRYMWGVVLHEYCHAYLQILTGHSDFDKDDDAAGYDGTHGKHFQRCIYAVDRRARQLLGVGAMRTYVGRDGMPINYYDAENHIVTPKTSKWAELRQQGYHRVIQACQHSLRKVVYRRQQLIKSK